MRPLLLLGALLMPGSAVAHEGHAHPEAWASWTFDPSILVPLLLSAALYAGGVARLWTKAGSGRGVRPWQAASFAAGWIALAGALVSPLHALGERLFTAHMIEHEIMMALAAPLIVHARPGGALLWGLPQSWRAALGGIGRLSPLRALWRGLTDPLVATVLHGLALWVWHAPALFNAALQHEALHWLQHLSFLVTALFFWWALLEGKLRQRGYGAAIFYLFATALHTGFLGILLTMARTPLYEGQEAAAAWGMSPLEDQQLAGLIMWVPAGMIYAAVALVLAALWVRNSGAQAFGEENAAPGLR
jgi:putative membrane protein